MTEINRVLNTDEILEKLKTGNIVIEAPPGFGKTRLAVELASRVNRVAIVERTVEEIREVLRMSTEKIIPLYGKEKICPHYREKNKKNIHDACRRARMFGTCRYKYKAVNEFVRFLAGKPRDTDEIIEKAEETKTCPYPSMLMLKNSRKIVATYGFILTHPDTLVNRDLIVFDEAQELLDIVIENTRVIDDEEVERIVSMLKKIKNPEAKQTAYVLKQCWRKTMSFSDFVKCLERQPFSNEEVDSIINTYYNKGKSVIMGRKMAVIPPLPSVIPEKNALFLSTHMPPFIDVKADVVRVNSEKKIRVVIDDEVTSRFEERSEEMYRKYADKIITYYSLSDANLVVFPSYDFMNNVLRHLPREIVEKAKPREEIRSLEQGDIVFDVAGGSSTEGVNPSPCLRRVIVAGLPYPSPTDVLNALSKKYGFDNVYTYIALQRVVQTLGRLRFRENADGVLLDKRFRNVVQFMPPFIEITR